MNGYTLADKMRKKRNLVKLTVFEQALFYELVAICNENKWPENFQCSNKRLYLALNTTERSLRKARKNLIDAGLINYQSGKSEWLPGSYSFNCYEDRSVEPDTNTSATANKSLTSSANKTVVHSANKTDYINNINKNISEGNFVLFIAFNEIKNKLLADENWKEQFSSQADMGKKDFLLFLPTIIDHFLRFIVSIGEEHTIQTLSDAKRRFYWWWKKQRIKYL